MRRPVRGAAIVISTGLGSISGAGAVERLCHSFGELPLVSIGLELPGVPSFVVEQTEGMRELVEHVVQHGRRRVVFLSGPATNPDAELRLRVCRETLARHGLPLEADRVAFGYFSYLSGIRAVEEII